MQVELLLHALNIFRGVLKEFVALEAERKARRIWGSEGDRGVQVGALAYIEHRLRGKSEVERRRR